MFIDLFPLSQNVTIIFLKIQIFTKKNTKEFKLIFINVNFAILTRGGGKMGLLHAKTTT